MMMMPQSPSEPMMMGSPTSPAASHSQYLPAFLMGDQSPMVTSPGRPWNGRSNSPPRTSFKITSPAPTLNLAHASKQDQRQRSEMLTNRVKEKSGAPPVQGLIDHNTSAVFGTPERVDLNSSHAGMRVGGGSCTGHPFAGGTPTYHTPAAPRHGQLLNSSQLHMSNADLSTSVLASNNASLHYTSHKKTPPSPAQVDPFYTQGETLGPDDELDETWVSVFGFPPAATSFILQQFSQYGNILKHSPSDGNWLHIHYQSKLQAKKALSKNGKIFAANLMIGVTQCIDKSVMYDDNDYDKIGAISTPTRPYVHNASALGDSLNASTLNKTCGGTPIRPLTAAYKAASSDQQMVPLGTTPQKNTNILSKAMDYMFGW